jgi:hypothetical protein
MPIQGNLNLKGMAMTNATELGEKVREAFGKLWTLTGNEIKKGQHYVILIHETGTILQPMNPWLTTSHFYYSEKEFEEAWAKMCVSYNATTDVITKLVEMQEGRVRFTKALPIAEAKKLVEEGKATYFKYNW